MLTLLHKTLPLIQNHSKRLNILSGKPALCIYS